MVAKVREGDTGNSCLTGTDFSLAGEMSSVDGWWWWLHRNVKVLNALNCVHLNMVKMVNLWDVYFTEIEND